MYYYSAIYIFDSYILFVWVNGREWSSICLWQSMQLPYTQYSGLKQQNEWPNTDSHITNIHGKLFLEYYNRRTEQKINDSFVGWNFSLCACVFSCRLHQITAFLSHNGNIELPTESVIYSPNR